MSHLQQYDAVVIGAGQAGTPLSIALAQAGMRTALIEREHVGGTCINEGCTPTKTMIASGRVAYLARRAADYGVHTGAVSVDLLKVRERKRGIVNNFRDDSQSRIETTANLDLLFGEAKFTGPKSVEVQLKNSAQQSLSANYVFINTGARASRPKLHGLENVAFLDNASIMELGVIPEHLLILGGGYIGLEFGQLFRRFGSRVTIIHTRDRLLAREDPDVSLELERILRQDGVEVLLNAKATQVIQEGGNIRIEFEQPRQSVFGSHLLVATGRVPNSDALNLGAAGVETDGRGFIKVSDRLETTADGVYALGDVKGGPAFTHISYDDFRIIRANLLLKQTLTTTDRLIPYVMFTDPELGRVGLTETEARHQLPNVQVAKLPMNAVARALEMDEPRGFIKAIVNADTKEILGAAVLGIEGGETMALFELAMMGRLPYTKLRDGIFAHPTLAEALNNLFEAMDPAL